MKKEHVKKILIVLAIGGMTFIVFSIIKSFSSGLASGAGFVTGIFTGLKNDALTAWNSVAGIFGGSPDTPEADAATANEKALAGLLTNNNITPYTAPYQLPPTSSGDITDPNETALGIPGFVIPPLPPQQ